MQTSLLPTDDPMAAITRYLRLSHLTAEQADTIYGFLCELQYAFWEAHEDQLSEIAQRELRHPDSRDPDDDT
jgi:hypothetical protein